MARKNITTRTIKYCCCCEQDLPIDSFASNRYHKDGRAGYCKECSSKKQSEYYRIRKEKWNNENKEKL